MSPKADAQVGSDDDKGKQVESGGADGVVEGLGRRMYRVNEVEEAKAWIFVKEQNQGMKDGNGQGNVPGPVVKPEIVESVMRPGAVGAIAESHEQAEEKVEGDGADGGEADVSGEIQDSDACRPHEIGIFRSRPSIMTGEQVTL